MPVVSVHGMSGKVLLQDFELVAGEKIARLAEATKASLGLTQPGLDVKLIFDVDILPEDELVENTALADGSILTAKVADILSGVRELTNLPSYDGDNISEAAAKGAWMDVLRLIEEEADLNATYEYGYSALMHLAACPHEHEVTAQLNPVAASQIMRWMLMRGANVMHQDSGGKIALHAWGKYGGCMEQGEVLLEFGANVNHEMSGGYTPLWYVRNYKRPQPPTGKEHQSGVANADRRRELKDSEAGSLWKEAEQMLVSRGAFQKPS